MYNSTLLEISQITMHQFLLNAVSAILAFLVRFHPATKG